MGRGRLAKYGPPLLALALIALFLRLGFWQLDRADHKAQRFAAFEAAVDATPRTLDRYRPLPRYTPVTLRGQLAGPVIFLDNQLHEGRPGVHVFARLVPLSGDENVLVNLGWLPIGPRRELPEVSLPADEAISGLLADPPPVGVRLGESELAGPPPWRVPYLEPERVGERLNSPLAPQILLATDDHGEFVRQWRPATMPPERHQAYAFQWFSLASAVGVILLIGVVRSRRKTIRHV